MPTNHTRSAYGSANENPHSELLGGPLDRGVVDDQSGLAFNKTLWEHFRQVRPDLDRFSGAHTVGIGKPPNEP